MQEARAIAQVDVLWQQEEIILQHLVATHGYLLGISQCEQARHTPTTAISAYRIPRSVHCFVQAVVDVGPVPRLNAAAVLVGNSRAALTQNIAMLEERLAGVVAQLKASQVSLQRYAEVNRSVHAELVEAGCLELAEAKQRLWRVETEMCDGISRRLKERVGSDAGAHSRPPPQPRLPTSLAPHCPLWPSPHTRRADATTRDECGSASGCGAPRERWRRAEGGGSGHQPHCRPGTAAGER